MNLRNTASGRVRVSHSHPHLQPGRLLTRTVHTCSRWEYQTHLPSTLKNHENTAHVRGPDSKKCPLCPSIIFTSGRMLGDHVKRCGASHISLMSKSHVQDPFSHI